MSYRFFLLRANLCMISLIASASAWSVAALAWELDDVKSGATILHVEGTFSVPAIMGQTRLNVSADGFKNLSVYSPRSGLYFSFCEDILYEFSKDVGSSLFDYLKEVEHQERALGKSRFRTDASTFGYLIAEWTVGADTFQLMLEDDKSGQLRWGPSWSTESIKSRCLVKPQN